MVDCLAAMTELPDKDDDEEGTTSNGLRKATWLVPELHVNEPTLLDEASAVPWNWTVNFSTLCEAVKLNVSGSTMTFTPGGGVTLTLYKDTACPTFVTNLVALAHPLESKTTVMDG